jgi:hypothetical protein
LGTLVDLIFLGDTKMNIENIVGYAEMAVDRENDMCPMEYTVVLEKYAVDSMLFELVEEKFNDILPRLLEGVEYTPEELIGYEWWTELTILSQRQAHLCLKHMATMPDSRLIDMAIESSNKTTFRIN